jgi:DNA-binding transcriptional regulator LsrR (DeoR family)
VSRIQGLVARRTVGAAGASFLRGRLSDGPIKMGVSWGRTIEQIAMQLSGVRNPRAMFVSLLGSLTFNSASNPFEVVQAFAAGTGGEGHFMPAPFIANSIADRKVLKEQRSVAETIALTASADLFSSAPANFPRARSYARKT